MFRIIPIIILIASSCTNSSTNKVRAISVDSSNNNIEKATISLDSANKIYMNIIIAKPYFIEPLSDSLGHSVVIGVEVKSSEISIKKIEAINNNWQIGKQVTLVENDGVEIVDSVKVERFENKKYLYINAKNYAMGSGVSGETIGFYLFDCIDLTRYGLEYYGDYVNDNQISGDYTYDSTLRNMINLKNFLEAKAQNSKYIYKKTAADFDINNAKNFVKKFLIDNPNIQERKYQSNEKLKTTYYNEDISNNGNTISQTLDKPRYKIFVVWRFGVIGFDKSKKKFFPIYITECQHGCDLNAQFDNDNILRITYEYSGDQVKIDLGKFMYSKELGNKE